MVYKQVLTIDTQEEKNIQLHDGWVAVEKKYNLNKKIQAAESKIINN